MLAIHLIMQYMTLVYCLPIYMLTIYLIIKYVAPNGRPSFWSVNHSNCCYCYCLYFALQYGKMSGRDKCNREFKLFLPT